MAINPVTSTVAHYVHQVMSGGASQAISSAALEEAKETAAATRQEAARGDQVAIRKLARLRQAQQMQESKPVQAPREGERSQTRNTPAEEASESPTERASEARGGRSILLPDPLTRNPSHCAVVPATAVAWTRE